jgi:hypothetical protein
MIKEYVCEKLVHVPYILKIIQIIVKLDEVVCHILNMN